MIAIRLEGRLGNQLFQYAFIFAAANKLNTSFYIDEYIQPSVVDEYFQNSITTPHNSRLFRISGYKNFFSFHIRRFYNKYKASLLRLSIKSYSIAALQSEIKYEDQSIYCGYFQSDLFFKEVEEIIKSKFVLKSEFIEQFKIKYSDLYAKNTIVAIHLRRSDYLKLSHMNLGGDDLSLPINYYWNAIEKYKGRNVHFVFISDDPEYVKDNFQQITNKTISRDTEIMDFQHLLNAHECIISNSTFSWWGAWLNTRPDKKIYAPEYFLGWRIKKEYPQNIYPHDWVKVSFNES